MELVEMNNEVEYDTSRASGPFSSDGFTLYRIQNSIGLSRTDVREISGTNEKSRALAKGG